MNDGDTMIRLLRELVIGSCIFCRPIREAQGALMNTYSKAGPTDTGLNKTYPSL